MTRLTFLGTSASTPSKERNLSGISLEYEGNTYLFDCPEGAQRQMMKAGVSYMKTKAVFLSHFHGDHTLGLPGLLATFTMFEREETLEIMGPRGIREKVGMAIELSGFKPCFDIICKELKKGTVLKEKSHFIKAFPLKHDAPCFGFVFEEIKPKGKFDRQKALALGIPEGPLWRKLQEGKKVKSGGKEFVPEQVLDRSKAKKPKKIAIVADTAQGYGTGDLKGADILVHEASFGSDLEDRARQTRHSTALQAAGIAKNSGAKRLFLYHISARYRDPRVLEKEAQQAFPGAKAAGDLEQVEL